MKYIWSVWLYCWVIQSLNQINPLMAVSRYGPMFILNIVAGGGGCGGGGGGGRGGGGGGLGRNREKV